MPNAAGKGNHRVEGVEKRDVDDAGVEHPNDQEQPDEGPAMSGGGAMPGGSNMNHWDTASPSADATDSDSMPHTKSTPMPGETKNRTAV